MSGVWVFKNNGVMQRVENPERQSAEGRQIGSGSRRKILVYLPTGQTVTSYGLLQRFLTGLGWEIYHEGAADFFQFHKRSSIDLISLPRDFSRFSSVHMYDIVVKNPNTFQVRDI